MNYFQSEHSSSICFEHLLLLIRISNFFSFDGIKSLYMADRYFQGLFRVHIPSVLAGVLPCYHTLRFLALVRGRRGILTRPFPVVRNQKEDVFEYGTYFLESLGNCPLEAVQCMLAVFTFRIKVIMVSGATD